LALLSAIFARALDEASDVVKILREDSSELVKQIYCYNYISCEIKNFIHRVLEDSFKEKYKQDPVSVSIKVVM